MLILRRQLKPATLCVATAEPKSVQHKEVKTLWTEGFTSCKHVLAGESIQLSTSLIDSEEGVLLMYILGLPARVQTTYVCGRDCLIEGMILVHDPEHPSRAWLEPIFISPPNE